MLKIGLEPPNLSNIENGKYYPSLSTLWNIIEELNIEPNQIFDVDFLSSEKQLDERVNKLYNSLPLEKKQCFYRLLSFLSDIA